MTVEEIEFTCALWYWRRFAIEYELFETEREAADYALYLIDYAEGVPQGVQFSDGRLIQFDRWDAYGDALEEQRRRVKEKNRLKMKTIKCPFTRSPVNVEFNEPEWLGIYEPKSFDAP